MNAHAALDVVDAYVDALLDTGPVPVDVQGRAEAAIVPVDRSTRDDTVADAMSASAMSASPAAAEAARPAPTPPPRPMHGIASIAPAHAAATTPLRPQATDARGGERTPAATRELPGPQPQRWVRVTVDADSYALELLCVQEVVRLAPIVAMRGAATAVLGVMNLRGRIVPVFDLGLWLGVGQVRPDERSRIVVVERDDELIGVLVSAVEDVVTLSRDRIEPPVPGADPGPTLGVARVGPSPTVLLDAGALYH